MLPANHSNHRRDEMKFLKQFWQNLLLILSAALILVTIGLPFNVLVVFADESDYFDTRLTSTYTVDLEGNTRVEHTFKIRNETPEYFISRYELKLGSELISNINVSADNKPLTPTITQDQSGSKIEIEFPDSVVGKDKIREFSVSYLNPVMSQVNGLVLETFIPAMNSQSGYDQHQVILVTPLRFGYPSRIKPDNYSIKQDGQNFVLTYDHLPSEGISAIYGSQQLFKVSARYFLDNPHSQPAITQVSLPPDTPYQKIHYELIEPQPQSIESDPDGNWIATYFLPANSTTEVTLQFLAQLNLDEVHPWLNPQPNKEHLNQQQFWNSQHTEIKELAATLTDPLAIYQDVVNRLSYTTEDLSQKRERLGALESLRQPQQATCQEFTDLFIALARANQIPARRATGYAHSNDPLMQPLSLVTDVLHAWPEYYDSAHNRWTPIDPTWGSTMKGVDYFHQFDLKHIVFAYNGRSSRLPLAAGNYKLPNQDSKDIQVEFTSDFPVLSPNFSIKLKPKTVFGFASLPSWYELEIINHQGQAWYQGKIELITDGTSIISSDLPSQLTFLPFETKHVSIQVFNQDHFFPQAERLSAKLVLNEFEKEEKFEIKTIKPLSPKLSHWLVNSEPKTIVVPFTQQTFLLTPSTLVISVMTLGIGLLLIISLSLSRYLKYRQLQKKRHR